MEGQRIQAFSIQLQNDGNPVKEVPGITIGRKRILTFESTEADSFIIKISATKAMPLLSEISAYLIDEKLIEK